MSNAKLTGRNLAAVLIVGIVGIVIIECVAMWQGMDGQVLSLCVAAIAALVAGAGGFGLNLLRK